ncbi:hypothetical protein MESS2_180004 [Mesorhizobium metallidurans STM 2683]|uniref:Uncharacterized protein n=1 Tax=Mesorhizobium metallidurans STM 2683 TaxID=1297569 RepID=M5EP43_9HYPH|nr:hypothetical protein MESS2_180004 [Mesorhizobium metallidurans STM 2683]
MPQRKTSGFSFRPEAAPQQRNETIGLSALSPVVSGVLIRTLRIFVKFHWNPRDCWLCILNEFRRLPLVLALFSSN